MFGLFKKEKQTKGFDFSVLNADMHSHLLPGIDDGAKDMENSIELINGLKDCGYTKLITTPHILWDIYKNTPDIIRSRLEAVQIELQKRKINIELMAAAEYYLDDHINNLLKKKEPLLTVKNNWVLVEFSMMHRPINMKEMIFDLLMAGYKPIIAHPERYTYLHKKYDVMHDLMENGCMFQLNILSVSGGYGKTVKEMAAYFLNHNFYNFMGTDTHHTGHVQRLLTCASDETLQNLINSGRLINNQL